MTLSEIALLEDKSVFEIECYLERALASLEASSMEDALDKANLSEPCQRARIAALPCQRFHGRLISCHNPKREVLPGF
jgi:hypothetical protein